MNKHGAPERYIHCVHNEVQFAIVAESNQAYDQFPSWKLYKQKRNHIT